VDYIILEKQLAMNSTLTIRV
jgi:serine/threonine protein kinase